MTKKIIYSILAVGVLIVLWFVFGSDSSEETDLFIDVGKGDFEVIVTTTGELQAKNSIRIRGPRGAQTIQVWNMNIQSLVPEGTMVEKGDLVAELDRSDVMTRMQNAQLEVQQAESQLEKAQLDSSLTLSQARDELENLRFQLEENRIAVEQSVYESPAVQRQNQIELERTERRLAQEEKNYQTRILQEEAKIREIEVTLEQERNTLSRIMEVMNGFTILAPENGMVVYTRNWRGQKTTTGSTINAFDPVVAELPDFSSMESITYVNEVDIQKIKTGQTVDIGLDAVPEKELTGVVTLVANIGEQRPDTHSKVFEVKIEVNESDTTLRPAMTTSNDILVENIEDALFIPLESVHTFDSTDVVFKRDGIQMVMQQIVMGAKNENDVVILEGLHEDDQVLISMPSDISGMEKVLLPDEVLEKYRQAEDPEGDRPQTREVEMAGAPGR
ncbi:efflux RND transporter periplasmic adaptor subunit [Rhodohalobacter sp. 614A]|uniref:efflux RND transporter periplasmic adaptor subunit n=1 Tax=Rhodohalobacter sp. 614A TaxID=2908649 RepID=UPI001F1E12AB|nr:efflux RND transporter periplasmic adaptor subunit [Rhodohalobacter sp. 614A]